MKRESILFLIFLFTTIVFGFTTIRLYQYNSNLKAALPYLFKDEIITSLDLINLKLEKNEKIQLPNSGATLIYIFSGNCVACDNNRLFLKKYAKMLGDSIKIITIIPGKLSDAYDEVGKSSFVFPIFVPENLQLFKKKFRLKLNLPQVIILSGRKVKHVRLGNMSGEDAVEVIGILKNLQRLESNKQN